MAYEKTLPEYYTYKITGDKVVFFNGNDNIEKGLKGSHSGTIRSLLNSKKAKLDQSKERGRVRLKSWIKLYEKILRDYESKNN